MLQRLVMLLLLVALQSVSARAEDPRTDQKIARRIATKLKTHREDGKLDRQVLTITVRKRVVTVTGQIEDAQASRLILDSIISSGRIAGIELNLGIGRELGSATEPAPMCERARRPVRWDDGDWQLDFGNESAGDGTSR